jgi:hypothetical protein
MFSSPSPDVAVPSSKLTFARLRRSRSFMKAALAVTR